MRPAPMRPGPVWPGPVWRGPVPLPAPLPRRRRARPEQLRGRPGRRPCLRWVCVGRPFSVLVSWLRVSWLRVSLVRRSPVRRAAWPAVRTRPASSGRAGPRQTSAKGWRARSARAVLGGEERSRGRLRPGQVRKVRSMPTASVRRPWRSAIAGGLQICSSRPTCPPRVDTPAETAGEPGPPGRITHPHSVTSRGCSATELAESSPRRGRLAGCADRRRTEGARGLLAVAVSPLSTVVSALLPTVVPPRVPGFGRSSPSPPRGR